MYVYTYVRTCEYVCMHIHTHTHTHTVYNFSYDEGTYICMYVHLRIMFGSWQPLLPCFTSLACYPLLPACRDDCPAQLSQRAGNMNSTPHQRFTDPLVPSPSIPSFSPPYLQFHPNPTFFSPPFRLPPLPSPPLTSSPLLSLQAG